jgi:hypothetical protein
MNKKNNANKKYQKKNEQSMKAPFKDRKAHKKKEKGLSLALVQAPHWAWGNHKEGDCHVGQERITQQNNGHNQVATQAALATILNPDWYAPMANMVCNMASN